MAGVLRTMQKGPLYRFLSEAGVPMPSLEFAEEGAGWAGWGNSVKNPVIRWLPNEGAYSFSVMYTVPTHEEEDPRWLVRYTPGRKYPVDRAEGTWHDVLHFATEWASMLVAELHAEDPWSALAGLGIGSGEADAPIPEKERPEWYARVEELEKRVAAAEGLGEERHAELVADLAELREQVATAKRRSVQLFSLGVFLKLLLWGVSPDAVKAWIEGFFFDLAPVPALPPGDGKLV